MRSGCCVSSSAEVEGAEGASASAEGVSGAGEAEDESTAAAAAGMVSLMDAPPPTEASTYDHQPWTLDRRSEPQRDPLSLPCLPPLLLPPAPLLLCFFLM